MGKKDSNKINKRKIEKYKPKYFIALRESEDFANEVLNKINTDYKDLGGSEFRKKTEYFKNNLDKLNEREFLIDAFSVAYKAIQDVYGISLYKVQLMGAYGLNNGDVSEMKTGEGKTLTAILPSYYNALFGNGVHIITVNEYLASRDASIAGKVLNKLGLTVGHVNSKMNNTEKKEQYNKDITYSTNSEVGFDYLRDNLVRSFNEKVQRGFNYAIIDEVDSILIDEARTPLIISGGVNFEDSDYEKADSFVKSLIKNDYTIDKETKQSFLTDSGVKKAEKFFETKNLFLYENSRLFHLIVNALQANFIYKFDYDYTIRNDEIVLIDSFTGRLLEGRQFSEGLNQAIEAKENLKIKPETKTFASITYQNLFRMYKKLSGMSGTALAEEEEFLDVYNMRVLQIPTNLPIARIDLVDIIFATKKAKYKAVLKRVYEIHKTGQPILLGTKSVFESEILSNQLNKLDIKHEVLNAKNHAREAEIISKAGYKNQITIATNMAGRGTDIKLGPGVVELGGLFVLGTERNESRRIDDQLRGRSGRQGDIGYSQFYVSLDDEIMQRSGIKKIQKFLKLMDENPISSKSIQRSITSAQRRIEGLNYDYRKSIVEYDDVLNTQRILTYKQRDEILKMKDYNKLLHPIIKKYLENTISENEFFVEGRFSPNLFADKVKRQFNFSLNLNLDNYSIEMLINLFFDLFKKKLKQKVEYLEDKKIKPVEFIRNVLLMSLDMNWQDQIDTLSKLKSGIRYRQYAQKNPVQVYVQESDKLFNLYKKKIIEQGITIIMNSVIQKSSSLKPLSNTDKTKEIIVK